MLCFVELILALLAAKALPAVREVLESNTIMLSWIIDIAADGADVFTGGFLLGEIQLRPDRQYGIVQIHHTLGFKVLITLRRMCSAVNGRVITDKLAYPI